MSNPSSETSQVSPSQASPSSIWAPAKAPLPPHRLAKLANALGVSTPLPAVNAGSFNTSSASLPSSRSPSVLERTRSQTPSGTSPSNVVQFTPSTKFLLHVIPPDHLPHESDDTEKAELAPPPPSASGYHKQFRRGIMVPLCPTLQSQLNTIAKEYALPSSAGMILYLVNASPGRVSSPSPPPIGHPDGVEDGEPGPRLTEIIWKHLWSRAVRADREESAASMSRNVTPGPYGIGLGLGVQASPISPQPTGNGLRPLATQRRDLAQPHAVRYPFTPSPSTPSSASDLRSLSRSAPPSSSQSDPETPDTSSNSQYDEDPEVPPEATGLDLPGLNSNSLIPILAKVEFDIDRRRAGWYEPWVRSRRRNYATRADSRLETKKRMNSQDDSTDEDERKPPLPLSLVNGLQDGYAPLVDPDEELEGDATVTAGRINGVGGKDPLEDVFGTDADTWADIHADMQSLGTARRQPGDLALSGAELSALGEERDGLPGASDEAEVAEIIARMGDRPALSVSIPSPPSDRKSKSSDGKRHVPPPLVLLPRNSDLKVSAESSPQPPSSATSSHLPYLRADGESPSTISDDTLGKDLLTVNRPRSRSPTSPTEKRDGGVFDDLRLNLGEYDEKEIENHLRMTAQLDAIEKEMAQFSPMGMKHHSPKDSISKAAMPPAPKTDSLSLPTPRTAVSPSWPAVPYSSLDQEDEEVNPHLKNRKSTPQLAVNGVSTSAPKAFKPNSRSTTPTSFSAETALRKREHEEEERYSIPAVPQAEADTSMVIPLSPDPFGRFSSSITAEPEPMHRRSSPYWDTAPIGYPSPSSLPDPAQTRAVRDSGSTQAKMSETTSSRFSADSMNGGDDAIRNSSLMSMKSITKKLWRKSKKNSISIPADSGRFTPLNAPPLPRTSLENQPALSASKASSSRASSPSGGLPLPPTPANAMKHNRTDSDNDPFHFDNDPSIVNQRRTMTNASGNRHHPKRPSIVTATSSPAMPTLAEKNSMRKSILKSWKGPDSAKPGSNGSSTGDERSQRASLLDLVKPGRQSISMNHGNGSPIPANPKLPDEFIGAQLAALGPQASHRQSASSRVRSSRKSPSSESNTLSASSPPSKGSLGSSPRRSLASIASSRESESNFDMGPNNRF